MKHKWFVIGGLAGLGLAWLVYSSSKKPVIYPNDAFTNKQGYSNMMRGEANYTSANFVKGTDASPGKYAWPDIRIKDTWGLGENGGNALAISGVPGDRYGGLAVPDTRAAKYATFWRTNQVTGSHL